MRVPVALRAWKPIAGCSRCIGTRSIHLAARQGKLTSRPARSVNMPFQPLPRFESSVPVPPETTVGGKTYPRDAWSNTPPSILERVPRQLHLLPNHPISILREIAESHFASYKSLTPSSPVVSIAQNFDDLGFAPDHPGRSLTDSYYLNKDWMLRTHTSAHEIEAYKQGLDQWLLSADVYRRDEIDASHYPVFHQMEGSRVWSPEELKDLPRLNDELAAELAACPLEIQDETTIGPSNPVQPEHDAEQAAQIAQHLKHSLNSLIFRLFGQSKGPGDEPLKVRWIEAFFPFTTPSYEVEVFWNGEWLELLGCGVVMQKTLQNSGVPQKSGWAFGLGLERIAMVLFSIPDIRLFWSQDSRFLSQFQSGTISTFKPYSRYPPCYKDMSFWVPSTTPFHENDFCEVVRDVAGDLVENVQLIDDFKHPKTGKQSKCYRLNYRSMDRSLSNEEVNRLQDVVIERVVGEMGVEMR